MAQALPFLAVAGSLVQGVGGLMAGESRRDAAYAQAQEERRAAAADIRQVREEARSAIGEQLASQVGNGLEGGSGTALDALRQSQIEAALDVMELRRQGIGRSRALEREGDLARREGRFALLSGVLGAGSKYLGQQSDWAQARDGAGEGI